VFFAIRDAIAAVGEYKINPPLNAPATSEEILRAIESVLNSPRPLAGEGPGERA
jgi:xanthine dehydrogenase large subunit